MDKRSIEEALSFVEENDVKFIRLAFCDILGRHKNVSIMPQELDAAFEKGVAIDYKKIAGDQADAPELYLIPDPSTIAILPWRPQTGRVARIYCDIHTNEGVPFGYDGRSALKQTLHSCKEAGFLCRMGLRSEFYLFKTDEDGNPTDITWDKGGYLDVAPLDKGENIRREICLALEEMGIQPESSHHEMGPGQNEIDFSEADALRTADYFMTYKNVVSSIAAKNGGFASFEPVPVPQESGNGLHLKVSLHKGGENIAQDEPKLFESFMAGVYRHIREITVFLNPLEASYDRFGKNEAPKYISWSKSKASRLFRVLSNDGITPDGFVLRSPDSAVNPYLAFAFILEAGLDGIKQGYTMPADEEKKDVRTQISSERLLPTELSEAIREALDSTFVQNSCMKEIAAHYLQMISAQANR